MKCPVCNVELRISERQGIEIDYCPQCRGVWLDRGELDKIIERSSMEPRGYSGEYEDRPAHQPPPAYGGEHPQHYGHKKHKRRSLWEDLFDFD